MTFTKGLDGPPAAAWFGRGDVTREEHTREMDEGAGNRFTRRGTLEDEDLLRSDDGSSSVRWRLPPPVVTSSADADLQPGWP